MLNNFIIAKEGWPFIGFSSILLFFFYVFSVYWLMGIFFILSIFFMYFFRNPRRLIVASDNQIVAPADGKILEINKIFEDTYLNSEAIQVRIFLSVFDVHINRIPISGKIEYIEKLGLKFYPAYQSRAGKYNVKNRLGINTKYGKVLVVQITGFIARRIVCYPLIGDEVRTGERFGLIKFGSCTEIYLPSSVNINVVPGQKIRGGETIIGEFN